MDLIDLTLTCPNCQQDVVVSFGRRKDDSNVVYWKHENCPNPQPNQNRLYDFFTTSLGVDGDGNIIL